MADKLNVEEALKGEENTAPAEEARLLTNGEENTTHIQLVTLSSYTPDKTAAPNNFVTRVVVPSSASNSGSEPCDRGVAESLQPKPDECNTSPLRCGQKRERESEDPSDVPVKRRSRPSEDSREELVPDYDVRCAELWIDGEMAACEAYELSKPGGDARRQHAVQRQLPTQIDVLHFIRNEMAACYQPITKMLRSHMQRSRAEFTEVISRLNAIHRDTRELFNEVRGMQEDGRRALDAVSLMNERMSVIQRFMCDLHQVLTTRK